MRLDMLLEQELALLQLIRARPGGICKKKIVDVVVCATQCTEGGVMCNSLEARQKVLLCFLPRPLRCRQHACNSGGVNACALRTSACSLASAVVVLQARCCPAKTSPDAEMVVASSQRNAGQMHRYAGLYLVSSREMHISLPSHHLVAQIIIFTEFLHIPSGFTLMSCRKANSCVYLH
jgi:hypothetical protein